MGVVVEAPRTDAVSLPGGRLGNAGGNMQVWLASLDQPGLA